MFIQCISSYVALVVYFWCISACICIISYLTPKKCLVQPLLVILYWHVQNQNQIKFNEQQKA